MTPHPSIGADRSSISGEWTGRREGFGGSTVGFSCKAGGSWWLICVPVKQRHSDGEKPGVDQSFAMALRRRSVSFQQCNRWLECAAQIRGGPVAWGPIFGLVTSVGSTTALMRALKAGDWFQVMELPDWW